MSKTNLKERQLALWKKWRETGCRRSHAELAESLEGLVVKIASKYRNGPFSMSDLKSEGRVGMLEGLERFDPDVECGSIPAICSYRIVRRLDEYMHSANSILYVPKSRKEKQMRFHLSSKKQKYESEGWSPSMALDLAARDIGVTPSHAAEALSIRNCVPFDVQDSEDDENFRQFEDKTVGSIEQEVDKPRVLSALKSAMSGLDARERHVISTRLTDPPRSFDELAEEFNVSRTRVTQIHREAMRHIRFELEQKGLELGDLI
ncbi:RNA polymerase sigma factor (sigma-70 family) [Roseovarius halotolerans]|uniref:RNA polymerase sigma factor RpoH n=1 Tax=Roseovarius halotolerans TaxID=505353 RepID=A0A1X6Y4X4_9RHOB|nr:sigma-70 family RNA polymerase sigma factor [Roseovarius halotolerans]RKT35305.1 RNA polymerase sigma factor (sigma-70 family) [Roseovarius halotolerans]SLN11073.1 RNA polymerase sigma factor RpoH [Roseovarius halotolerans]